MYLVGDRVFDVIQVAYKASASTRTMLSIKQLYKQSQHKHENETRKEEKESVPKRRRKYKFKPNETNANTRANKTIRKTKVLLSRYCACVCFIVVRT